MPPGHNTPSLHCVDCGLQKLCFPPTFSSDALDRVTEIIGQPPMLPRHHVIYRNGDVPGSVYAVRSGSAKTSVLLPDGQEQITGFYLPGEVIGLENLGQDACVSTAVTLEKTTLCVLPVQAISQLSRQLPELQSHLFQIMSTEIRADYQRMHLLASQSADARVAAFLIGLVSRQTRRRLPADTLSLPMTRAELGNHLGLALETVSRSLGRMASAGWLEVSGKHLRLLDMQGLQTLTQSQCA